MTGKQSTDELLDACIQAAIELGYAKAEGIDSPEHFATLKNAITEYSRSFHTSFTSTMNRQAEMELLMTRNAYLAYLFAMGELSLEELPLKFESLEP